MIAKVPAANVPVSAVWEAAPAFVPGKAWTPVVGPAATNSAIILVVVPHGGIGLPPWLLPAGQWCQRTVSIGVIRFQAELARPTPVGLVDQESS